MGQLRAVAAGLRGSFSSLPSYDGTYSAQRQGLWWAQEVPSIRTAYCCLCPSSLPAAVASGAIEVPAGTVYHRCLLRCVGLRHAVD